jgi:hypothetical protein
MKGFAQLVLSTTSGSAMHQLSNLAELVHSRIPYRLVPILHSTGMFKYRTHYTTI